MSNKPLVSVITIFLNEEKFIEESIESVFAQTYDNWELLLVDDGSTDSSTQIAQRYAEQYPDKVRYLEHESHQNLGQSSSRNLGIHNARGEYISLLDADDIYLPEKLTQQVGILVSHPEAAMVYGPTEYWYSWTGKPEDQQRDCIAELVVPANTLVKPPRLQTLHLKDAEYVPCTCGLLVKRQLCEEIGGFDEKIQNLYEDQVFLAKIFLNVPVFVEGGCWDKYRQHLDSTCWTSYETGEDHYSGLSPARLAFLTWLMEYVTEQKVQDTDLHQALREELWPYRHPFLYRVKKLAQGFGQRLKLLVKSLVKRILPVSIHCWLKNQLKSAVR